MRKLLLAAAMLGCMSIAAAQSWPSHALKYIVPFPVGGSTDTLSRIVASKLQERLGQPVVVENNGGVGGSIGMARLAREPADGYTIGLGNSASHAITPNIHKKMPYDPITDFTPISMLTEYANVLVVNPRLPAADLKEFLALARARGGKLTYSSAGIGSSNHLTSELLAWRAGVKFTHIPYKGNAEAVAAVVAGHVDWLFATASEVAPFVKSGQVRALGTSGTKPEVLLPQVAPIADALPGFEATGFMALFAPAHIPAAVAQRLNKEVTAILAMPDVERQYAALGLKVVSSSQDELTRRLIRENDLWRKVIDTAGIEKQ